MVRVEECLTRIYTSGTLKQNQENSSNKSENENVQCVYGSQFTTLDTDYVNYLRETVPKTNWNKDYLSELWSRKGEFLKNNGTYDFDDIAAGAAYAYSSLYQEIVDGYDNGTREVYVYDKESGERRLLSKDEELEKLNAGFEELIKWDQMVAKSRMETEKALKNPAAVEFDADFSSREITDYIQEAYLKYRQLYLSKKDDNPDISSLVSVVLNSNHDIHNYCLSLFTFAKVNCVV